MKINHDEEIKLEIEKLENTEIVTYECSYVVVSYHRNNSLKDKSIWSIDENSEINCFKETHEKSWVNNNISWGVKYNITEEKKDKKVIIHQIGISEHNEELKIARFIDSSENHIWHGYPANYRRKNQDIPPTEILLNWVELGILKKHQVIKIKQGKKCNL